MTKLLLNIPAIFGDHHATAVRALLEPMDGIKDLLVSPAFHQVEIEYDSTKIDEQTIKKALADQGYVEGTWEEVYPASPGEHATRHTEAFGQSIHFVETPPAWQGRPLWPCPGLEFQTTPEE